MGEDRTVSDNPQPPTTGGDPQQPAPGWQPGWQESWQPSTGGPAPSPGPPYGQPPQVPYGAPQNPGAYGPVLPDHPQATTVLILGIVSAVACGFVAPVAWVMGNRVVREIDASNGTLGGRSTANVGRIIGIVWTVLTFGVLALGLLGVIVYALTFV
jgi:hypothetical protein